MVLCACVAGVPLCFAPWAINAFELPKVALLRVLLCLGGLLALLGALVQAGGLGWFFARYRAYGWRVLAFALSQILSTLFSVDPRVSWWGTLERQQGLATLLCYPALFALILLATRDRRALDVLWCAIVWPSAVVVAYGLAQSAGFDLGAWQSDARSVVQATLGRSNFVGTYLVLVVPLTAARLGVAKRKIPVMVLLVLQTVCLLAVEARGALLGMAVAGGILGGGMLRVGRRRGLGAALLILIALGGLFVLGLNLCGERCSSLASGPGPLPGPLLSWTLINRQEGSAAARLTIWRETIDLIRQRPLLGYGPETMRPLFLSVYPPELVYYQGRNISVDRAHNIVLDTLQASGIVGLVAYGGLVVACIRAIWRHLGRSGSAPWLSLGLLASIVGHLVDLQFAFQITGTGVVFWAVLAMGVAAGTADASGVTEDAEAGPVRWGHVTWLLPAALVTVLAVVVGLRQVLAARAMSDALDLRTSPQTAAALAGRATALWPWEPAYLLEEAAALGRLGRCEEAIAVCEDALAIAGHEPDLQAACGSLYAEWSARGGDLWALASERLGRAVELAPNVGAYHAWYGLSLWEQQRPEEALRQVERAVDLDATDVAGYAALANMYGALGMAEDAAWANTQAEYWEARNGVE